MCRAGNDELGEDDNEDIQEGTGLTQQEEPPVPSKQFDEDACISLCMGLLNGTEWGLSPEARTVWKASCAGGEDCSQNDWENYDVQQGTINPRYNNLDFMSSLTTTGARCTFVCSQKYRDAANCGGYTLGQAGPGRCSFGPSMTNFVNRVNEQVVYREFMEGESVPPKMNPPAPPPGKVCPQGPDRVQTELDICSPNAMERSICVKRWDGDKKMTIPWGMVKATQAPTQTPTAAPSQSEGKGSLLMAVHPGFSSPQSNLDSWTIRHESLVYSQLLIKACLSNSLTAH